VNLPLADQFFATARERYNILIKKTVGQPKPWTEDRIFQAWRFCNVHREHDKTTKWLADHIRKPLCEEYKDTQNPDLILKIVEATVIFRWFNRIETGETIKDLLLGQWDSEEARRRLQGVHPVVTGAYIIKGPDGYSKLDGVLYCVDAALPRLPAMVATWGSSLRSAWVDLCQLYYLGRFMSYEVVSDLKWTPVLSTADDIFTWANAGPGCARGLGWVTELGQHAFNPGSTLDQETMLEIMQVLLAMSHNPDYWGKSQKWEMREVEHWLCEFDKYKRAERGDRLKRRYQ
jgi:hypothetical protein